MCDHLNVVAELSKDHRWREADERNKPPCFWWSSRGAWLWHCNHEMRCLGCKEITAGRWCGLGRDGCPDFAERDHTNVRSNPRGWRE